MSEHRDIMTWIPEDVFDEEMGPSGVGGDDAVGVGQSIRFHRDDVPGALFTALYYPELIRDGQFKDRYCVTGQLEYLVCTDPSDPGGTEVWSDFDYDDQHALLYWTLEDAEKACRGEIERWRVDVDVFLRWDGNGPR